MLRPSTFSSDIEFSSDVESGPVPTSDIIILRTAYSRESLSICSSLRNNVSDTLRNNVSDTLSVSDTVNSSLVQNEPLAAT
jgi:hypothetical protein